MGEYYIWCSSGNLGPLLSTYFYVAYFWNMKIVATLTMQMTPLPIQHTAEVLNNLTNITQRLITWFANNQMKVNHGKCHLLLSTQENANIQIANTTINCLKS